MFLVHNDHILLPGSYSDSCFPNKCTFIFLPVSSAALLHLHSVVCPVVLEFFTVIEYSSDIYAEMHSKLRLFWFESIHIHEMSAIYSFQCFAGGIFSIILCTTWGCVLNHQLKIAYRCNSVTFLKTLKENSKELFSISYWILDSVHVFSLFHKISNFH